MTTDSIFAEGQVRMFDSVGSNGFKNHQVRTSTIADVKVVSFFIC